MSSVGRAGIDDHEIKPKEAKKIRVNIRVTGIPPDLMMVSRADSIRGSHGSTPRILRARYVSVVVDTSPGKLGAYPHEPSAFCWEKSHWIKAAESFAVKVKSNCCRRKMYCAVKVVLECTSPHQYVLSMISSKELLTASFKAWWTLLMSILENQVNETVEYVLGSDRCGPKKGFLMRFELWALESDYVRFFRSRSTASVTSRPILAPTIGCNFTKIKIKSGKNEQLVILERLGGIARTSERIWTGRNAWTVNPWYLPTLWKPWEGPIRWASPRSMYVAK